MSESRGLQVMKLMNNFIQTSKGYESIVLKKLKFVSAGDGNCLAELKVGPEHLNGNGTLHGGFIGTLVDTVTSTALMTDMKSDIRISVSTNINVSYLKGAKEGDDIVIDAKTLRAGRTMAFLEVELKDKTKGYIIAKGSHTKFLGETYNIDPKLL